jgi:putative transposase
MARTKAPQVSEFPFHITARTPNAVRFPIPLDIVWDIFQTDLYISNKKFGFEILSFVLMPNHFHLLARTQSTELGKILNDLMRETSRQINRIGNRSDQNWGQTAFRCHISNNSYFYNVYRYIYQNPLRAGLCHSVIDYPYSTLSGLIGQSQLLIPVSYDPLLDYDNLESTLNWLNTLIQAEHLQLLRKSLGYHEMKLEFGNSGKKKTSLILDAPPSY